MAGASCSRNRRRIRSDSSSRRGIRGYIKRRRRGSVWKRRCAVALDMVELIDEVVREIA